MIVISSAFFLHVIWFNHLACAQSDQSRDQNKSAGYDTKPLQKLTEFRKQHRKTIDGRLCAAAFVQDDQTYTDCTSARAPDGTTGQEWCYLEVQLLGKGPKDWNFCVLAIDYNIVRNRIKASFQEKAASIEMMVERIDAETRRASDMINRFKTICGPVHEALKGRIQAISGLVSRSQRCTEQISQTASRIDMIKIAIEHVEQESAKRRKEGLLMCENCETVIGYEDDSAGDGIRGLYYSDSFLSGPIAATQTDTKIDIAVAGKGPVENIAPQKFSIRWNGFLKPPDDDEYIFITETDGAARVWLNGKCIINYGLVDPSDDDYRTEKPVVIQEMSERSDIGRAESEPQSLVGGDKVRIRVEMVHSSHLKANGEDTAIMRLFWRSSNIPEEIIPPKYFFTCNMQPPLKLSGLNPEYFDVVQLTEGEFAYKDSREYYIADLPQRLEGRRMIRTFMEPTFPNFTLTLSSTAIVYVASLLGNPVPLGPPDDATWRLHESEDLITVLKAESPDSEASESKLFRIRFIEMRDQGSLKFMVRHKKQPFFLFVEQKKEDKGVCGGKMQILSLPSAIEYAGCTQSSQESEEHSCEAALSAKNIDAANGSWRTVGGNGVGEFIEIRFKKPVEISLFRFRPRDDPVTWPKEISLCFDEECNDVMAFAMLHSNNLEHNTHELNKRIVTKYIKAEITQMYVNGEDTGGSFEFWGTTCAVADHPSLQEIQIEKCDATTYSLPEALPMEDGKQVVVICPHMCIKNPEGEVYGSGPYSQDSTLCITSIHSGSCSPEQETSCKILVTGNGPTYDLTGSVRNGITSMSRGPDEMSIMLTAYDTSTPAISEEDKDEYEVTFRATNIDIPGFLVDTGGVKKFHQGVAFGWLRQASPETCQEMLHTSNPLNVPGISFPFSKMSSECQYAKDCDENFWSMDTKKSQVYSVEIQVVNRCRKEGLTSFLQVNGADAVKGIHLSHGETFTAVVNVEAKDKKIILTAVCDVIETNPDICVKAVTVISSVMIKPIKEKK